MKRIIKCGTAFLLALVLCLCLLPTTAFAASKQVYIWNFPLSDDTLKSSGNWGHGVLNLRFGYRVGASSYTQFRCLDSWQGEVAPWQVERGFGPIFGAPKSGQEKAFGALLRHWPLRQPAVRTATEVCATLKLTLIMRRRICFGAISCKNACLPRVCRAFGRL